MLSWWCWSWRFKLNYSPEMRKEINREEFLASSKIAQFWNNHWRRKADVTGRCIRIWNLLLILMQICLKLHFRYHSLSDVDGDEDWLFAKTTYCRVACKRSHHQTVVGSPVYLYYLHASYLKLLIGKKTGFSIVFNYKYKLEFIFGIFHFWLVYKQIFWPRHDAGLNFLPCKLIHHILRNAIVILLMLVVNILT